MRSLERRVKDRGDDKGDVALVLFENVVLVLLHGAKRRWRIGVFF